MHSCVIWVVPWCFMLFKNRVKSGQHFQRVKKVLNKCKQSISRIPFFLYVQRIKINNIKQWLWLINSLETNRANLVYCCSEVLSVAPLSRDLPLIMLFRDSKSAVHIFLGAIVFEVSRMATRWLWGTQVWHHYPDIYFLLSFFASPNLQYVFS